MSIGGGVFVAEPVTGGILGRHLAGLQANGVTTHYQLQPLCEGEATHWDELIAPYESRELFHRKAWLDYLAASYGVDIRMWSIQNGRETLGYFCGGIVRKGPFRILGSPLKGWGTNFMGPVVNADFDQRAFLDALDDLTARERLAVVELEGSALSDHGLERLGYEPVSQPTYIVDLTPEDQKVMWDRIERRARQNVRKAKQLGVTVEDTSDPSMADEFYDQVVEVLARKNLFPPYYRSCPRMLFDHLKPLDRLFALQVREPGGSVVATGLFPHDDRTVYAWGMASRTAGWRFFPNDLLQWTVMALAANRGLRVYNMCGYGHFKSKFGGILREPMRWHKCHSRAARCARRGYELYFQKRLRLRGWLQHVACSLRGV
jgi:hypothetical protein